MTQESEVKEFALFCWHLCRRHHGSETSGFRTPQRNEKVGGHTLSKHTYGGGWGLARDIVFEDAVGMASAIADVSHHPRYVFNAYAGEFRIHVQGFPVGQTPEDYFAE